LIFARVLVLSAAMLAACAGTGLSAPASPGVLIAVGGGGTTDAIAARALELAGGPGARLLILPQASERPAAGGEEIEYWRARGATDVRVLDLADADRAREEIAAADFLWMSGGDQNTLMSRLSDAGVVEAIRSRWREGAAVGGTSAGAAVLSAAMIVGGDAADLESVRAGGTQLAEGLGLWSEAIVDQHFLERQRANRLLAAILDRPDLVGAGVAERTAVFVHADGRCEVIGDGGVVVLDARGARVGAATPGGAHSATGVRLAIYRNGDSFTLRPGGGSGAARR
jgi:cyanophycinase